MILATASRSIELPLNDEDLKIGCDVLQLLSSAMYHEPLIIYRELIQNALDSLDVSSSTSQATGEIELRIDRQKREIIIEDNGAGIEPKAFAERMCSLGASSKRQSFNQRGFRGVGRLAALGYCRTLTFTSRSVESSMVYSAEWDCVKLRSFLNESINSTLNSAVRTALSLSKRPAVKGDAASFFRVRLSDVVRLADDRLLDPIEVKKFVADCTPTRFGSNCAYGAEIESFLDYYNVKPMYRITVAMDQEHVEIFRRIGSKISFLNGRNSLFRELETFTIDGYDGKVGAIGWILHHEYPGNLANTDSCSGIRIRVGGIQIGDQNMMSDLFPEPRFNAWTVGEVHVLDRRIIPNGRRDGFEPNVHWQNVSNHLSVIARKVANRCRLCSSVRNRKVKGLAARDVLAGLCRSVELYPPLWELHSLWYAAGTTLMSRILADIDPSTTAKTPESVIRFRKLVKPSLKKLARRDAGIVEVLHAVLDLEKDPEKRLSLLVDLVNRIAIE